MIDQAKELFEEMAATLKAVAPGLSAEKFVNDVAQTVEHKLEHGAHEAAALLYNGSAFVMYPRTGGKDDLTPDHGVHGPDVQAPDTPQMEHERGGRGR
jgi:hypothetical protein